MSKPNPPSAVPDQAALGEGREFDDRQVEQVVLRGPGGTWAVAGVATLIVVAIYFAFYLFAYLPRGAVQ